MFTRTCDRHGPLPVSRPAPNQKAPSRSPRRARVVSARSPRNVSTGSSRPASCGSGGTMRRSDEMGPAAGWNGCIWKSPRVADKGMDDGCQPHRHELRRQTGPSGRSRGFSGSTRLGLTPPATSPTAPRAPSSSAISPVARGASCDGGGTPSCFRVALTTLTSPSVSHRRRWLDSPP
jgi:hypothetical protein